MTERSPDRSSDRPPSAASDGVAARSEPLARAVMGPRGERILIAEAMADRILPWISRMLEENPDGSRTIKENPRRSVRWLDTAVGSFVIKRYRSAGVVDALKERAGRARALTEWKVSHALRAAGIAAPEPVLVAERSLAAPEAVFVAFAIPHEAPLGGYLEARFHPKDGKAFERAPWLQAVAGFLAQLHDRGFDHRDFHGGNVLVCGERPELDALAVVDLHRVAIGSPSLRRRVIALADLCDTLRFAIAPEERATLVGAYIQALSRGGAGLSGVGGDPARLLDAVDRSVLKREGRRFLSRTRRCVQESSRFTAVAVGGSRGFRRTDVQESALFAAIDRARRSIAEGAPSVRSIARRSSVAVAVMRPDGAGHDLHTARESVAEAHIGDVDAGASAAGGGRGHRIAVKIYEGDGTRSARGRVSRGRAGQTWVAAHGLFVRGDRKSVV